jgi:hypothetical protein
MAAHIHAAHMAAYAKDAAETDKPWERWEARRLGGSNWHDVGNPSWEADCEYRRKPQVISVNGFKVPAPMRTAPPMGSEYWVANTSEENFADACTWGADRMDKLWFARGIAHLTEEAAVAHAKAMCGIDPNGGV